MISTFLTQLYQHFFAINNAKYNILFSLFSPDKRKIKVTFGPHRHITISPSHNTNTTTDVVPKASNKHFMDIICHIRCTHVTKLQNSTSQLLIKPTFSYYVQEITVIWENDLGGVTVIIIVTCHCKTSPISSTTNKAPIFSPISSHQGSFEKPQIFFPICFF